MRKLLYILLVLISTKSIGQPVISRGGAANTLKDERLMIGKNMFIPIYVDSIEANTNKGIDSSGAMYYDRSIKTIMYRQHSPKKWVDVSNSTYTLSSPSTVTVGGMTAGTTLTGKTWQEIIQNIVAPYVNPTFSSFSVSGQSTTVEVGTTLSGSKTFTWGITQNSGTVNYINIYDITAAINLVTNTPNDGSQSATITTKQLNSDGATQQWRGVGLDAGNGNAPFNSSTFTVTSRYYKFWGAAASQPVTSADVRALPTNAFRTGATTITLNTGTTYSKFYVALPPSITITSVIDETALNADITSSYVLIGTVNVTDAGGTARVYNLYEMIIGSPYGENHVHKVTHN